MEIIYLILRIFILVFLILFGIYIYRASIKVRIYEHNGHEVYVYAGWVDHYLKVDGDIVDRKKKAIGLSLTLSGSIDGVPITVKIKTGLIENKVMTIIDGVEIKSVKELQK